MEISFHGKRALVTGAGRGLGRELVKRLVKCGAEVIALSRTEEYLNTLKNECPSITTIAVDVGKWNETKEAVESIDSIDLLVNNAAVYAVNTDFGEITEEEFDRIFNVNIKGALNISQIVANKMKSQGKGGSIVCVSSILAFKAFPKKLLYSCAKASMDQMTRIMALELGPQQIRVNTVNPGIVLTDAPTATLLKNNKQMREEMEKTIPLQKLSEIDDVVAPILFLLSDKASMVHGTRLVIDGGASL